MPRRANVYDFYERYRPYVRAATRRTQAARRAQQLAGEGTPMQPVVLANRKIATSFWGKAWCDNLERYGDYENRLPRGRTYVRNGSVIDLRIGPGTVDALVSGSTIYTVRVAIEPLPQRRWRALAEQCSGHVGSLLDLLQGRFSTEVMQLLARAEGGLFPVPKQIEFTCSCPDWAAMCKHVAAVLYGVGARFDAEPELFFTLRQVDGKDLLGAAAGAEGLAAAGADPADATLAGADLAGIFGIDLDLQDRAREEGAQREPLRQRTARGRAPKPTPATLPTKTPANASAISKGKAKEKRKGTGTGTGNAKAIATQPPATRRTRAPTRAPEDDGLDDVFAAGLEVSAALLVGLGVPETTWRNWIHAGVLQTTTTKCVYRTTAATLARVRRTLAARGG